MLKRCGPNIEFWGTPKRISEEFRGIRGIYFGFLFPSFQIRINKV